MHGPIFGREIESDQSIRKALAKRGKNQNSERVCVCVRERETSHLDEDIFPTKLG